MSKNYPNYAWGVDSGNWGKITNETGIFQHFKLTRGLCGEANTVSFESIKQPGHFLRQDVYWLKTQLEENTEKFKKDASFRPFINKFYDVSCLLLNVFMKERKL